MSPFAEIQLIFQREMRKSVRSVKGIILAVLALLASGVASLVCITLEAAQRDKLSAGDTEAFYKMQEDALSKAGASPDLAHYLSHVPLSLHLFLKFGVWVAPALVVFIGFDSVSSDVQHRAVRYWTVRTRRWTYLLGKFLGLWATVSLVTLALYVFAATAVLIKGYISFGEFFKWGLQFWFFSALIASTWCAVAVFVSSQLKTPFLALFATLAAFFVLWLPGFVGWVLRVNDALDSGHLADLRWFEYIYPNAYDDLLINPKWSKTLTGLGAVLVHWVVFIGGGAWLFDKKDV